MRAEAGAGLADGAHLGVRRRVVVERDAVGGAGDDFAVLDDDRAEWAAAPGDALLRRPDGFAQVVEFVHCVAHVQ